MSSDINSSSQDDFRAKSSFWKGVVVGIAALLLILALVAAAAFFMMDRCPMCGRLMQDGVIEGHMIEDEQRHIPATQKGSRSDPAG